MVINFHGYPQNVVSRLSSPLCFAWQFTTLKPLGDRLLVKVQEVEEKTAGGILLPNTAQTKPQGGQVVAVGEGRSVGDKKVPVDVPVSICSSIVLSVKLL